MISLSPGFILLPVLIFSISELRKPIPEVVINSLSHLPLSTTFVSPVTIFTPALAASSAIESAIKTRSSIGKPSSMIKEAAIYMGSAPDTARSFTVPHIASLPILPPGKKRGSTTYESVVSARVDPDSLIIKESVKGSDIANLFTKTFSISSWVSLPPLPWFKEIKSFILQICIYTSCCKPLHWKPYMRLKDFQENRFLRKEDNLQEF